MSVFTGFEMYSGVGPSPLSMHENIKNRLAHFFKPNAVFYRGVGFGLNTLIMVTPEAAEVLVKEGFKTKEELSLWLAENTWELDDKSRSKDFKLEIVVAGGTTAGFELANLHYTVTNSIDKWR